MNIPAVVSINGKEIQEEEIAALPDQALTPEEWEKVRGNTPGFIALVPKMRSDTLFQQIEKTYLPNASYRQGKMACTYNDMIIGVIVPELMKRILELGTVLDECVGNLKCNIDMDQWEKYKIPQYEKLLRK